MKFFLRLMTYINSAIFLKLVLFILISIVLLITAIILQSQIPQSEWDLISSSDSFKWLVLLALTFTLITLIDLIFFTYTFAKILRFGTLFIIANALTIGFYLYFFNTNIITKSLYFHCFIPVVSIFMAIYSAVSLYNYYIKLIYRVVSFKDGEEIFKDEDKHSPNLPLYIPSFELMEHRINKSLILFVYPLFSQMPWGGKVKDNFFVPEELSFYQGNLLINFEGKGYLIKPISLEPLATLKTMQSSQTLEGIIRIIPKIPLQYQ